ncbi:MAG: DUF2628 domain-containing protein [Desulfobacteraceae bacterium]|nr:MAG: DUF2628 domain-containing protein [Desulfobacteraceae bacterium]
MEKRYNIVFKGELVLGYHIQDVRDALSAKFKIDGMALGRLFSGKPQIIKKAVDPDTARKFLLMMEKIGARCKMEPVDPDSRAAGSFEEKNNQAAGAQAPCPKCGWRQKKSEVCEKCGLLIAKYKAKDASGPGSESQEDVLATPLNPEADWATFIGPNADLYLNKFVYFHNRGEDRFAATWHWPAFFTGFWWFLYRKMYLWALISLLATLIPCVGFLTLITCGLTAHYLYYLQVKKKTAGFKFPSSSKPDKQKLAALGGTHPWVRWVFIVLLGIGIMGIIAAIVVPIILNPQRQTAPTGKQPESLFTRQMQAEDAVLKPVFSTDFGNIQVGTAFITHLPEKNQYVLVTAHSLFGSRGGFPKDYNWDELATDIRTVKATSIGNPSKMVLTSSWLSIPGAGFSKIYDGSLDLAALYLISDFGMGSLPLSQTLPKKGEKVWLITEMPARGKQFRFAAVIVEVNQDLVQYVFENNQLDPGSVIGAPVLNAESKVVAINTVIILNDHQLIGIGNPAPKARQKLLGAM